jgi:hypothetical protein
MTNSRSADRRRPVQACAHRSPSVVAADVLIVRERCDDRKPSPALVRALILDPPPTRVLNLYPHVVTIVDLNANTEPATRPSQLAVQDLVRGQLRAGQQGMITLRTVRQDTAEECPRLPDPLRASRKRTVALPRRLRGLGTGAARL